MFTAFIFFLTGVFTHKILQFFLSITPNYNIFKETEMVCLKMLGQLAVQQQTALNLLKIVYDSSEDKDEYYKIEKQIKLHYNTLINNSLLTIKNNLPYKVPYNTLNEAFTYYIQKNKVETENE